jgi:hypothetical protein
VVFKHDCGPSSLSSINLGSFSYVFMLHWLVYKLYNALNFSCAIRVIDLGIDMVFVVNMASYAISSSMILVIHNNMMNGTNHIV